MTRTSLICSATIFALLFAPSVFAQDGAEVAPADDAMTAASQGHRTALTISPIHLAISVVEVTAEQMVAPKMGAALIAGIGKRAENEDWGSVWELGAQFRYYALGDFNHGLQLGAEVVHIGVSASESLGGIKVDATAGGTTYGAFAGYKVAADFGLTFDIQIGYMAMLLTGEAQATVGNQTVSATDSDTDAGALVNLNLGWSF